MSLICPEDKSVMRGSFHAAQKRPVVAANDPGQKKVEKDGAPTFVKDASHVSTARFFHTLGTGSG